MTQATLTTSRIELATRRLASLPLWQQRGVACVAGAASVLAMAPFDVWPVLWLTLPALCLLADAAAARTEQPSRFAPWRRWSMGRSAEIGWWFGFGYFLAGLFWVGEAFLVEADVFAWLLPFAVTLLPAGLALFTAAAVASMYVVPNWTPLRRVLALAGGFGATEWLRGHILTGFPWNTLGYALTGPLPLMQSASVFGIYGLTIVTVLIFAGPAALLRTEGSAPGSSNQLRAAMTLAILPLVLLWAAGSWRLAQPLKPTSAGPKIRIVQPSIPQLERMQSANQRRIFDRHLALSLTAPDGHADAAAGVALIVWAEAAMPFVPLAQPVALADIGKMLPYGTRLLSGAVRVEPALTGGGRNAYNSALLFEGGETARLLAYYDKQHLVPFGEFLPAQPLLEAIGLEQLTRQRGGFTPGHDAPPAMLIDGLGRVVPLICYEAIFPLATVAAADRPDLLMVITNDSWFGDTTGPRQHYQQARVRSVETGVPMIRASANGISAAIDGMGREQGRLGLNVAGTLDVEVPQRAPPTIYGRLGDRTFFAMLAVLIIACGLRRPNG